MTTMLNGVFKNCTSLESIALGSTGLTNVNARLLAGCTSLISVGLPSSLLSIGRRAFANCTSLGALQLPSLTSAVAYRAFEGCAGLAAMVIPAGLMQVNDTAFANCACLPSLYAAGASFCDCNRSLAWPCPAADRAAAAGTTIALPMPVMPTPPATGSPDDAGNTIMDVISAVAILLVVIGVIMKLRQPRPVRLTSVRNRPGTPTGPVYEMIASGPDADPDDDHEDDWPHDGREDSM